MPRSTSRVAVIGAGLAGVGCATALRDLGADVTVFEKSRGFGGRCATKRWDGHSIDHGAQYFTLRSPDFISAVVRASGSNIVEITSPVVSEAGRIVTPPSPRFYHKAGNSRIAADLGAGLNVVTGCTVNPVSYGEGSWLVQDAPFDAVVSTAPWPQTSKLFNIEAPKSVYAPCLTLLLIYKGEWVGRTTEHYGVRDDSDHPLAWSACENHKKNRILAGFTGLVAQASTAFSQKYLEEEANVWSAVLRHLVEERWGIPMELFHAAQPHRWRYANVESPMESDPLPAGLFFAGDAMNTSRVESAWLAGRQTAAKVSAYLA